ncbi:MAG: hypothetical protein ABEJ80_10070 [Halarchaeum sp.]
MNRRIALLVAACALVALAGCSAPVSQPHDSPVNGTQVVADHEAVLHDAGSFTVNVTLAGTSGNGRTVQSQTVRADLDTGAYRLTRSANGVTQSAYVSDGAAYVRTSDGDRTVYAKRDVPANQTAETVLEGSVLRRLASGEFAANGTTTVNGERVYRYEATTSGTQGNTTTTAFVRSDGLVVRVDYAVRTDGNALDATVTYTDVGETDPRPDWLDAARANTSA